MKVKLFQKFRSFLNNIFKRKQLVIQRRSEINPDVVKRIRLANILKKFEKKRLPQRDMDLMWARMRKRIKEEEAQAERNVIISKWRDKSFSFPRPIFARVATQFAVVLILLIGGSFILLNDRITIWPFHSEEEMDYQLVNVDFGNRLNIQLNDGTTIIADAGSEIRYPKTFTDRRDIYLKGEAYFEVAPDRNRPFYVHANHALVRVLGTKFNVRAWDENPRVAISVNEGKVALSQAHAEKPKSVIVTKNEMSLIAPDQIPTAPKPINAQDHLGWMKNNIKFNNATVEEVVAQLHRWYNYEFVIQDSTILKDRLTVHILPTNVNDVLEVISLLTNTTIEKKSNRILLIPKK